MKKRKNIEQVFELEWMKLDKAIGLLEGYRTENYVGKFIFGEILYYRGEKCGQNPCPKSF